jgi:hypothetical protein
MTVLDDVKDFIAKSKPKAICDDCVASRLQLSVRQHANHKTRELALLPAFDRRKGVCSFCGGDKMVIRDASR